MRLFILLTFLIIAYVGAAQQHLDTIPAHYPGGQGAWMRYLIREFHIPPEIEPEQQSVRLEFHISSTGKISQVRMISGDTMLLPTLTNLLVNSGPWVPAMAGKKAVASVYQLPINYHLEYE
jgi:hypothetical protein